jgi:hypothetical protein
MKTIQLYGVRFVLHFIPFFPSERIGSDLIPRNELPSNKNG